MRESKEKEIEESEEAVKMVTSAELDTEVRSLNDKMTKLDSMLLKWKINLTDLRACSDRVSDRVAEKIQKRMIRIEIVMVITSVYVFSDVIKLGLGKFLFVIGKGLAFYGSFF